MLKSGQGATTAYPYDGKNLLKETDGLGGDPEVAYNATIDSEYGNLLGENQGGAGDSYHMYDGIWSTQALADPDGQVQGLFRYQAFGLTAMAPESWETLTLEQWSAMTPQDWSVLPVQPLPTSLGAWGQKQVYLDEETQLFLMGSARRFSQ